MNDNRVLFTLRPYDYGLLVKHKQPYESVHAAARRILLQGINPVETKIEKIQAMLHKFGIIEGVLPIEEENPDEPRIRAIALCDFYLRLLDQEDIQANVYKGSFLYVCGQQLYVACPSRGVGNLPIDGIAAIGCIKWGIVLNADIEKKAKIVTEQEPEQVETQEEEAEDINSNDEKEVVDATIEEAEA